MESRNGQEESISDEDNGPPRARLHAPSDIQGGGISFHKPLIDDAPLASSQNRRIAQLETRVAKMETLASQASSVLSNLHPMSPESMLEGSRRSTLDPLDKGKEAEEPETMILRGSSFKTQYYGSTNDTVQIIHVCLSFPVQVIYLTIYSFQNSSALPKTQQPIVPR